MGTATNAWCYGLILPGVGVAFALFCGLWAYRTGDSIFWVTILGFLSNTVTAIVIAILPGKDQKGPWQSHSSLQAFLVGLPRKARGGVGARIARGRAAT